MVENRVSQMRTPSETHRAGRDERHLREHRDIEEVLQDPSVVLSVGSARRTVSVMDAVVALLLVFVRSFLSWGRFLLCPLSNQSVSQSYGASSARQSSLDLYIIVNQNRNATTFRSVDVSLYCCEAWDTTWEPWPGLLQSSSMNTVVLIRRVPIEA